LLVSLVYLVLCLLFALLVLLARRDRSKELEILVLRHDLAILRRQAGRPRFEPHDRLVVAALSRVTPRHFWSAFPVRPDTLLRWHRRLVARRWTYPHRRPGRPPLKRDARELIERLARENTHRGYVRIVGELRKLGINVSATLVRSVLAEAGIPPAPQPSRRRWLRAAQCGGAVVRGDRVRGFSSARHELGDDEQGLPSGEAIAAGPGNRTCRGSPSLLARACARGELREASLSR
jgi:putative transposase